MSTVLITGAGRGIGLATARAFLAAGWKVLALDKDFSSFDLPGAERIEFDLRNLPEIKKLAENEVHTLVNNAGVLFCDPYEAIPEANKREILAVNIEAPAALIWGRDDHILPWRQALAAKGEMALHLMSGVGHIPHVERPAELARIVARHLGRTG